MFTKFSLTAAALAVAAAFGVSLPAQAQAVTDVLVRDGAGNVIATDVREFDWNTAGSGLAQGFTPVVGSSFTFLYQANLVAFNDINGQPITPLTGLNASFGSSGYEYTVTARITETVTGVSVDTAGNTTATFATSGGTATIFFDNAGQGGVKSSTASGNGFDDGTVVGVFDVVAGVGLSNFTTFAGGAGGLGATKYDFLVDASGVNSSFIEGNVGPIGDLHFTSGQVLPPGSSVTTSFHNNAPNDGNLDLYPTTSATAGLLLKVDGSNTFTTAIPEPETYALMLAGLGAIGFMTRRRRKS